MKASVFIAATLDGYIATPEIQGFLAAGLIQELTLTRIPTLLGKGIPLFSDVPQAISLMPIHTQQYDNGYVQTRYRVIDKTAL